MATFLSSAQIEIAMLERAEAIAQSERDEQKLRSEVEMSDYSFLRSHLVMISVIWQGFASQRGFVFPGTRQLYNAVEMTAYRPLREDEVDSQDRPELRFELRYDNTLGKLRLQQPWCWEQEVPFYHGQPAIDLVDAIGIAVSREIILFKNISPGEQQVLYEYLAEGTEPFLDI